MISNRGVSVLVAAVVCLLALATVRPSDGARILGFFPTLSRSHFIVHLAVAEALADRGHNVTVVTTLPPVRQSAKFTTVLIDAPRELDDAYLYEMINEPVAWYHNARRALLHFTEHSKVILEHPTTQQFMRDHQHSFDLMILGYFLNDAHLGLAAHFDCPVVLSFSLAPLSHLHRLVGNPLEVAYVPLMFSSNRQPLTFMQRVHNFVMAALEQLILRPFAFRQANNLYRQHFPADRYPPLEQMYENVSLILTNHHFSQGPIRANVPAVVEIGGIQIDGRHNPLPADIAAMLDASKEGAIYFSLGTNVQGHHLSRDKLQAIFNVLSRLPYKVLWQWADPKLPGTADNIMFRPWVPQSDVLAHANVKLFLTHGGLGGIMEAQHHGVPMVGIPLFAEQPMNMRTVQAAGLGLSLDYRSLNEANLKAAIDEVMREHDNKYRQTARAFARLYRDRPQSARASAVFWIEYVLRHRGAPHMQSPAVHLSFWQLHSLDVLAYLVAIGGGFVIATVVICKTLCSRYCAAKNDNRAPKKKSNARTKKQHKSKSD